jgi:hypothetical protein
MLYAPVPLQLPAGHAFREVTSFTPGGLALGAAWDSQAGNGVEYEAILRWQGTGTFEALAARIVNREGMIAGTDGGLVVFSACHDSSGVSKPLAIVEGALVDLGAQYPGRTGIIGMNAHGVFVGKTWTSGGSFGFVATTAGMSLVPTPSRAYQSSARVITDDGTIFGVWQPEPSAPHRGFVVRGGVSSDLREFLPVAVNQALGAVGWLSSGKQYTCGSFDLSASPPVFRPLPLPAPANYSQVFAIDDVGRAAGYCWSGLPATTPYLGFVAEADTAQGLDTLLGLPGQLGGLIQAMSRSGRIAGSSSMGPFVADLVASGASTSSKPRLVIPGKRPRRI